MNQTESGSPKLSILSPPPAPGVCEEPSPPWALSPYQDPLTRSPYQVTGLEDDHAFFPVISKRGLCGSVLILLKTGGTFVYIGMIWYKTETKDTGEKEHIYE